ncbi:prophage regulatory protein [Sphingomonas sp. F9_3S_D5_B_2]
MKLIRLPEALAKTGLTRTRAYVLIAKNDFPQPVKIGGVGGRAIAFPEAEVDAWIEARMSERETAAAA